MLRIIIIKLLLLSSLKLYCQNSINDSLLYYEYTYFKSTNDTLKQQILINKVALYLRHGFTDKSVLNEINRVNFSLINNNSQKGFFLWNAAALSYINMETNRAKFYLNEYNECKKDTSIAFNLLAILINRYTDTIDVNKRIIYLSTKDTLFKNLDCFIDLINYNRKHLNYYLISSAIIPGSGTVLNGFVLKGITSLAIISSSLYAIVKMVEFGLYINAALWGTGVGLKFYTGNIKLTEQTFYKAEAKKKNKLANSCELKLKNILNNYPITLKDL